jgi:hypothetical protein
MASDLTVQIAFDGDALSVVCRVPVRADGASPFLVADVVRATSDGFRDAFAVCGWVIELAPLDDEEPADGD